jgi:glycosyltransferase involved in cell wall biosynthesis
VLAKAAGAEIVQELQRGYGAACLAGIRHLEDDINIVLFADADGSDVPEDAARLVSLIAAGNIDLAIGSRTLGTVEHGAMSWPQRFGNWLAPALIRLIWDVPFTDLGPLRAIHRDALNRLQMSDRNFGWTVEMQVRAAKLRLQTCELPVGYRKRIGISKISGTVSGVFRAGVKILYVVAREAFGDFAHSQKYIHRNNNQANAGNK